MIGLQLTAGPRCNQHRKAFKALGCLSIVLILGQTVYAQRDNLLQQERANEIETIQSQLRGLVQNELTIVHQVCKLDEKQIKDLLNVAESRWLPQSSQEMMRRLQQHVHGTIDFDGLVERSMQAWCKPILTPEQMALYVQEIEDRQFYRKEAMIAQMLVWLQDRLTLSADQLQRVDEVLRSRWKERWYRSIEATFDNETLLPEVNRGWLDGILTNAQRSALAVRSPAKKTGTFKSEYPRLDLKKRFAIGSICSSPEIELANKDELKELFTEGQRP